MRALEERSASKLKAQRSNFFEPENGDSMLLRNFCNKLPVDMV